MIEAVRAERLSCRRGNRLVLSGLGFGVSAGRALILTGPNGAGKTTLLRTLAGFLAPAGGHFDFLGPDLAPLAEYERQEHLHFIGHLNGVKARLSVIENVAFWQNFYGPERGEAGVERAENALDAFGLLDLAEIPAAHLSAGQTRRLALARLIAVKRPLWLLDEPTSALDAASAKRLESIIAQHLSEGGIAVIATHAELGLPGAEILALTRAAPSAPASLSHPA
jgi:heme exporter protein A